MGGGRTEPVPVLLVRGRSDGVPAADQVVDVAGSHQALEDVGRHTDLSGVGGAEDVVAGDLDQR
jgi:hypothetical protein